MHIKKIKLDNFRQFKGTQTLEFSTDAEKNVTLILGNNNTGKTTLAQAFLWCLYGETDFKEKELINREVRDRKGEGRVSVEMEVVHLGKAYRLYRSEYYNRERRSNRVFRVSQQNPHGDWRSFGDADSIKKVKEMLPQELSRFFFFDGERIHSMSEELIAQKRSHNFEEAVRGLVGLNALQAAIRHFGALEKKSTVLGMFQQEISADSNLKIQSKQQEVEKLARQIEKNKEEEQRLEEDRKHYEKAQSEIQDQLRTMQHDIELRDQYDQLKKHAIECETREIEDTKTLFRQFSAHVGDALSRSLLQPALEVLKEEKILDTGIPYIHADTIKFLLERKTCLCGLALDKDPEKSACLRELIKSLPPYSIGQMVGFFSKQIRQRAEISDGFLEDFERLVRQTRGWKHEKEQAQSDMLAIEDQIPDQRAVEAVRTRFQEAGKKKEECIRMVRQIAAAIGNDEGRKKKLENELQEIFSRDERNQKNLRYLRYATEILRRLNSAYREREKVTRAELERTINRVFEEIYGEGIELNVSENYAVSTHVTDTEQGVSGDDLEKNTAQSYAIIFAFISGIIEMAKTKRDDGDVSSVNAEDYPLVMDAPLSSFDKLRIKQICRVLPKVAGQVILFIKDTDGETAQHELSQRIGHQWQLVAENLTRTRIERSI